MKLPFDSIGRSPYQGTGARGALTRGWLKCTRSVGLSADRDPARRLQALLAH